MEHDCLLMYIKRHMHIPECVHKFNVAVQSSRWGLASLFICCSNMCSSTEVARFTWSQRGQGFLPRPWLLINLTSLAGLYIVCCSPKSRAVSHNLNHPPFLATTAICGAFPSHSSILFSLSSCPITFFTSFMLIWSAFPPNQWRRSRSGRSGFGRYTFRPYINIHNLLKLAQVNLVLWERG